MSPARRPSALWACPRCGHRFTSRNLSHSCGRYPLAAHFRGRAPIVRRLFTRLRAMARACGPVTVYAQKTRIIVQQRVRFGSVITHPEWLEAMLWLRRKVEHPALYRTENFGQLGYYMHFRLTALDQMDAAFAALMQEAYDAGAVPPVRPAARRGRAPASRPPR